MIAGRFEITMDEVDELVEAVAQRTAARIAGLFGVDPGADRTGPYVPPAQMPPRGTVRFGEHGGADERLT